MLEQLDLFGTGVAKKEPQNPLEKRAERKLTPPETVMVEEETVEIEEPSMPELEEMIVAPAPLDVEETLVVPRTREPKKEPKEKDKPGKRGRKSLKEMTEDAEFVNVPEDEILFRKQYYSIGEVAEMFKVNTSLLRYWKLNSTF
jgi:hypothetical protein